MKSVLCVESGVVYASQKAAIRAIGGDSKGLRACLNGSQQTHKGYHWEYASTIARQVGSRRNKKRTGACVKW